MNKNTLRKLRNLKNNAGSHSPSIFAIKEFIPELEIRVDACFLSNPYATDLFLDYFKDEIINTDKIRDLLEFYPSQNQIIASKLAKTLKIDKDNILIGNGAIEIIKTILQIYSKKIIVNIPTFSSYYEFVNSDSEVVFNQLSKDNDYNLDINEYLQLIDRENPDTIVLINPNNPNGAYIDSKDIRYMLSKLTHIKNIIIDESFIHFAFEENTYNMQSGAEFINDFENLIIIKSMSKDFGIAGIRAGYAIMSKQRVQKLTQNGFLWNSNGLAEYFFNLYADPVFIDKYETLRVNYIKETQDFIEELRKMPNIKVYPSLANFILIELLNEKKSDDFVFEILIEYGIYLRTCSDKIGLNGAFIRLASRNKEQNRYILDSLKRRLIK